jgi:hypothetical protein
VKTTRDSREYRSRGGAASGDSSSDRAWEKARSREYSGFLARGGPSPLLVLGDCFLGDCVLGDCVLVPARQSGRVASMRRGSMRHTFPARRFESHTEPRPTRIASPPGPKNCCATWLVAGSTRVIG